MSARSRSNSLETVSGDVPPVENPLGDLEDAEAVAPDSRLATHHALRGDDLRHRGPAHVPAALNGSPVAAPGAKAKTAGPAEAVTCTTA